MAIYKPSLLDKFKDFVNGLKGNWDQYEAHVADFEAHSAENATIKSDLVITVGSGGDFPTINAALESLYTRYPQYKSGGINVEIKLLTGFVMQEQVLVAGLDLGWVTITAEDNIVNIDMTKLTRAFGLGGHYPAFGADKNGTLPVIGALFDMQATTSQGSIPGIGVYNNSRVVILDNCGVINSAGFGLYANNGSIATAQNAIFDGAKAIGVQASRGSIINIQGASVNNADTTCIYAFQSFVNAVGVSATGGGSYGGRANEGGILMARNSNFRRIENEETSTDLQVYQSSLIFANNATGGTNQTPNTITANGIIIK